MASIQQGPAQLSIAQHSSATCGPQPQRRPCGWPSISPAFRQPPADCLFLIAGRHRNVAADQQRRLRHDVQGQGADEASRHLQKQHTHVQFVHIQTCMPCVRLQARMLCPLVTGPVAVSVQASVPLSPRATFIPTCQSPITRGASQCLPSYGCLGSFNKPCIYTNCAVPAPMLWMCPFTTEHGLPIASRHLLPLSPHLNPQFISHIIDIKRNHQRRRPVTPQLWLPPLPWQHHPPIH